MSIIGEFEMGNCPDNGSETDNLHMDNAQTFSLGLSDFEHYCSQTDLDTNLHKDIPVTQDNGVERGRHADLLEPQEL